MAYATVADFDQLVIEVIDREAAPKAGTRGGVTVVRDLRDVDRSVGQLAWVPSRAVTYLSRSRSRGRHWQAEGFDLFHLHYINRYTDAVTSLPRPLVMSVHDVVPHVPRLGRRLEHGLLRRLYQRPDAIVVHHETVAQDLSGRFGVPPAMIHVAEYPVLTPATDVADPPEGAPTILFFGALRPNKGLDVLGEAMELLRGHDLRLVIAGRGHEHLERRARQLQAGDGRIEVEIGFVSVERKATLFREASVIALPYTGFSSQSAVAHDSYGYGRPVVATDVGALGRTVREDGTGIVTDPNDPRGLADAILELLQPATWLEASAACRRVAATRTPERFGQQLRAVYHEVLT